MCWFCQKGYYWQIFKKYANYKWNSFVNWLTQHLPPKPKVIDEAFEHVKNTILKLFPKKKDAFDVEETKSALGEFPLGGVQGGTAPPNVNLGPPKISGTTRARMLKLKTQLDIVKYLLWVKKFLR